MRLPGTRRPPRKRFVAESEHTDMVRFVGILDRIGIREAELAAQRLDVARPAGEKQPARTDVKRLGVLLEYPGRGQPSPPRHRCHRSSLLSSCSMLTPVFALAPAAGYLVARARCYCRRHPGLATAASSRGP